MDKETAYEAWEALKQQFEANSKDQLFRSCNDFFSFSWNEKDDVSTHVAKLKSLWIELNGSLEAKKENKLPDVILVCKVLHILPTDFDNFRSSWMLITSIQKKMFDEFCNQLCMFERNMIFSVKPNRFMSLLRVERSLDPAVSKVDKPRKTEVKKETVNISNTVDEDTDQAVALVTLCSEESVSSAECEGWYIENGATKHVTHSKGYFRDYEEFSSCLEMKATGKESLNAYGKGNISFKNAQNKTILLTDVWYCPEISKKLVSILEAQDRNKNSEFTSTATTCILRINGREVLRGTRNRQGSLFKAEIRALLQKQEVNSTTVDDESLLQRTPHRWGQRLSMKVDETLID
ncbi:LOW QUALITY PROTEIN: uncharacterized protein [Bemisia tabaci]|uniref:LOW QUALITY PROTEIN: uncharacterized protein n=1 Tax=Bemisia tabaci TaxID=7038 RepID=UPI003B27D12A